MQHEPGMHPILEEEKTLIRDILKSSDKKNIKKSINEWTQ